MLHIHEPIKVQFYEGEISGEVTEVHPGENIEK
jgi:hypothetical protein